LVNEVAAPGQVLAAAIDRARGLARNAPGSLAISKALLAAVPSLSLQDGLRYAAKVNAEARERDELREGVRAFLEKREPRWRS
jgi:methylglutaconyl-CoA hydratase